MFVNAWTARGTSTRRAEPLIHASHHPPVPYSDAGDSYRAACGRRVRNVTVVAFDPRGPGRLCSECVNEAIRRTGDTGARR